MIFIIVFFCLVLNGTFAAFEMAFVTISEDDLPDLSAKINKLKNNPERTLSVIQVGITFVGAIAAAVGGTGAVEELEPYLIQQFQISSSMAEFLAVAFIIIPLTYLTVVFGELLPKTIALRHPLRTLRLLTPYISFIDKFLSPIVRLLEASTHFLLLKVGLAHKEDNLRIPKKVNIERLDHHHQEFVLNLVHLRGKENRECMIPWDEVVKLDYGDDESTVHEVIASSRHTRLPVVDGETLVGILHTKEYQAIPHLESYPWQSILRSSMLTRPDQPILSTLTLMQEKHQHLAVVEEEGEFLGIITMENILEEIVGDIADEDDDERIMRIVSKRKNAKPESNDIISQHGIFRNKISHHHPKH